jgi:glycosyltransferase involved in cell wall biosynthesis
MKRTPRIGIDALGIDIEGGARTSILNLLIDLVNDEPNYEFVIYLSKKEPLLDSPQVKQVILPFKKGVIARLFMQLYLPIDILTRRIDLVHFTKSQASIVFNVKTVFTIHDLTTIKYPEQHTKFATWYWRHIQPKMAKSMDAIITVSRNAADDIHKIYNIPMDKITVVYNTSQFTDLIKTKNEVENSKVLSKYNLPDKYLFYVGIIAIKKNLKTVIEAIHLLKMQNIDLPKLVLVGPKYPESDASSIFSTIKQCNLEKDVIYLGRLPKFDLFYIFKNAMLFFFPSVHEGFGIPCLEAMELGVPLIASRASAIPEIVGNAGYLIEDYMSPEIWAEAIRDLVINEKKRKLLIERGEERVKQIKEKYSYKNVTELYKRLLKNK